MRLSELKLNCPKCSHRTDASNMRKHIKAKHDEEAMTTFNAAFLAKKAELNGSEVQTCGLCGHQCASLSGLKSHKRERHGNREKAVVAVDPATISVFGGDGENGERSGEGTSEPPRKRFHGVIEGDLATSRETADGGGSSRRISCPFPDCNVAVSTRSLLVGHVNSHDSRFVLENNRFDREEDMRKWVADRCKETTTSFIVNKTVANSNGKTIYHHCQHEGCYERTGDVRYGHDTKKQTKKDTCPAFLRISISSDCSSFNVIGCFQHHGHEQKIPSLKLSNEEKEIILKYMKDNLTNRQIVEKLCTEYSTSDRLHYVTYDDLRNFRRKEKLYPGRRNEEDLVSLLMRVEEKNEEDGIRLYNPPENATGEGFRLVIITPQQLEFLTKYSHRGVTLDDTHHCSKYNLKLSTMLVCDGYDRGVPVGFLLSHSTTSSDIEELFKCVKELHPSFNPAHVMTDEANVFWLGFRKVFPTTPTRKVLCRWHICRTWKKQAKIMLKEEHVGKLMPKLRELLREAVQANFTKRISEILHFLSELPNGEGAQFEEYFRSRYLAKCEEWSTVEREGIIFHTSMYAEAWHSLLKTQVIDGKKNIRADTLVHQLYRAIEYVIQKNFIQIARKLAKGIPRLAKNHKNCRVAAASLKEYVVLPEPAEYEGELEFLVGRVGGDVESMYRVVQKASCMCLKNENCHCNCGACGYKHSCTCLVQEAGVCCKHVHMVLLSNDRFTPDSYSSCHSPVFDAPSGSFPSPSSTSLSIRPAAPVSLDDVDQTEKDNALKNFDKLVNAHSALEEHLRQLMKRNSRSAADEIQKALDSVMALLPNSQPSLPPRRASATNCSARDVMNKHIRLEPRRYSRPCPPSTSSAPLVPIAELSVCSICLQVDAPLPEDADPMEDSAQWNYWKQCPECELPAHWECALAQRLCAHCNVAFVSYE